MCKASIIVRAYNEEEHLGKLLYGIESQEYQDHEVIVVDSGSTDRTRKIAHSHNARVVRIEKEQFTFGKALNVGCEIAKGEYLVFVSAHVYPVSKGWLGNLLGPFRSEAIRVSYGKQRGGPTNNFSEKCLFQTWFPDTSEVPQRGYFCNNANCAIRKSDWDRRRYDEDLTGLEDLHWAKQAVRDGGKVAYVSDAEIVHVHEENWSQVRNRYRREAIALRGIEDDKLHFSLLDAARLTLVNIAVDAMTSCKNKVLLRTILEIALFRINQFIGTYQGFNLREMSRRELVKRFYYPSENLRNEKSYKTDVNIIDYNNR